MLKEERFTLEPLSNVECSILCNRMMPGYEIYTTRSTAKVLNDNGVCAIKLNKLIQEAPTVIDLLLEHNIDIRIDTSMQGHDTTGMTIG